MRAAVSLRLLSGLSAARRIALPRKGLRIKFIATTACVSSPSGRRENIPTSSTCGEKRNWSIGITGPKAYPPEIRIFASRAKLCALQDTAMMRCTSDFDNCSACASAPARGGSNTTELKSDNSPAIRGMRNKSRASATVNLNPAVVPTASSNAAIAWASLS